MKKAILFVIAIALFAGLCFGGCSRSTVEPDEENKFCRVLCLKEDGIVVWTENIGNIYVKQIDTSLDIELLDTVVIVFSERDLEAATGTFTDAFGEEQSYFYILENPESIRHTTEKEPTFG